MAIQQIVPFNFNDIYSEIEKEFKDRGYDTAQGSNTSQLNTVMSYAISMLNANTALNVSETLLPYAEQRKNIINIARNFGYEIQHKTSFVYNLTLELEVGDFVIPKYTEFKVGDKTYYYLGRQIEHTNTEGGSTLLVQVKEGKMHRYDTEPDSLYVTMGEVFENGVKVPQYYIDIPYINIEENGLEVYCSYFDDYGVFLEKEQWEKASDTYIEVDERMEKEFIRIDNIEYGTPRIYFKYAGLGKGLQTGAEVFINALETSGKNGAINNINDVDAVKFDIAKCKVKTIELVSEGTDEEENISIKENAPKLYNSANRMIIANDYIAACNRDTRVRNSIVWGGEDEFPKAPGHIWFTFLPEVNRSFSSDEYKLKFIRTNSDYTWDYSKDDVDHQQENARTNFYDANYIKGSVVRSNEKDKDGNIVNLGIWDNLDALKVPTLVYHNRHPIFCIFDYQIEIVKYLIAENKQVTHQDIFDLIDDFFIGNDSVKMEDFDTEYFDSSLIKRIDKRITDISGINLYTDTHLLLNEKTVVLENPEIEYRDIYIPLALPYEKYFTDDGYLMIDRLPNIDTKGFISYNEELGDLYVDWSAIQKDIDEKMVKQKRQKLIVAPVRAKFFGTYKFSDHPGVKKALFKFCIYPDSVDQVETTDYTFNNTIVTLVKSNGERKVLKYGIDWFYKTDKPTEMTFGALVEITDDDVLECETHSFCGFYYLFNAYTKEILVHLFVDGSVSGYEISLGQDLSKYPAMDYLENYLYSYDDYYLHSNNDFYLYTEAKFTEDTSYVDTIYTTPRSYLTTTDNMYMFTTDKYYLTTNGYALTDEDEENSYTGPIIKEINKWMYLRSALKLDLFYRNRLLNLKYSTYNFKVLRNVIPYLRSVEFLNIVD